MLHRKIILLFSLYFCQGLPGGFLAIALPVLLREQGHSLKTIGFAGLLSLPWLLKVFWAPLVDRFGSDTFGRRKSWLIPAQIGILGCTMALAFTEADRLLLIALLFLLLNMFAATQDIAVDAWAVDMLSDEELGPGNSAQVAGFKIGNLFGGGVLLSLSAYIGWTGDFLIMGLLIGCVMIFAWMTPEPATEMQLKPMSSKELAQQLWKNVKAIGPIFWLFLVYCKFGETLGGAMIKPMLVDHGFTRETIGVIDGIVGSISTILGALVAGLIIPKVGWSRTLGKMAFLQGLALVALAFYQLYEVRFWGFLLLNSLENFAGGAVGVAVFVLGMKSSTKGLGASHFTACQVIYMMGAFLAGPISGIISDAAGNYLPVMLSGGVLSCCLLFLAPYFSKRLDHRLETS